ncbi:MAG: acyltransferase [Candidatus Merdivicinus sp.]|jgi:acetyltransferase-like isoleucine patch superfamily enzyme
MTPTDLFSVDSLPQDESGKIILSDELFAILTRYANQSDNLQDNLRRAEFLGFGGREIRIAPGAIVRVRHPEKIGRNIFIGLYDYINGDVAIGNNTLIGPHCSITAGNHKFDPETGWFSGRTEPDGDESVEIGEGSWLASGVMVTAGVKIGRKNLICANSVVTKNTPDYAIMAGTPARQVGSIDPITGEYHWKKE